jgi:hypothetical protein
VGAGVEFVGLAAAAIGAIRGFYARGETVVEDYGRRESGWVRIGVGAVLFRGRRRRRRRRRGAGDAWFRGGSADTG